jgi:hypothetical protein
MENTPAFVAAYSVLGVLGSMDSAWTERLLKPVSAGLQLPPLSVLVVGALENAQRPSV